MVESFDIDPADLRKWQDSGMEEKRYEYDVKPGDLILDIGAYQGEWSKKMVEKYDCRSYLFEPVRVPLLDEIRTDKHYSIVEAAAWTFDGRLNFGGNGYWTSHYLKGIQVYDCVDILHWLNEPIKVCKINIEGGEYELLSYILLSGLQKNIENFQIQFHKINDGSLMNRHEIQMKLSETHRIKWGVNWVFESWEIC